MYGNIDAAIKFFNTISAHLKDNNGMKMTQSKVDPCVFFKLDDQVKLRLIVSITVDDCSISD